MILSYVIRLLLSVFCYLSSAIRLLSSVFCHLSPPLTNYQQKKGPIPNWYKPRINANPFHYRLSP
jgi:hypothetical protein